MIAKSHQEASSIPTLEKMVETQKQGKDSFLTVNFSGEMQAKLIEMANLSPAYRFFLRLEYHQIQGIIDGVRTLLLKWALQLEKDGILGDGIVFSSKEKAAAAAPIYNTINNFHGPVQNSQIQQHTHQSSQTMAISEIDYVAMKEIIEELLAKIDEFELGVDKTEELKSDLETMIAQLNSKKPKTEILNECWKSVRNITEGIAGSFVVTGLTQKVQWISDMLK